jgi:predicted small lipoprotein YifL
MLLIRLAASGLFFFILAGCGTKGPLFIPQKPTATIANATLDCASVSYSSGAIS